MPLECDGKEILEFKGIYLQKAFASKIKRQIPYTKVTKFLPLDSRGNLYNSIYAYSTDLNIAWFWIGSKITQTARFFNPSFLGKNDPSKKI